MKKIFILLAISALAFQLQARGCLRLDEGAARALTRFGKSLLPVGVTAVAGDFSRGELVTCVDPDGTEVGRGLVNYSTAEARKIIGHSSDHIHAVLGYVDEPELIHRNNFVVTLKTSPHDR